MDLVQRDILESLPTFVPDAQLKEYPQVEMNPAVEICVNLRIFLAPLSSPNNPDMVSNEGEHNR